MELDAKQKFEFDVNLVDSVNEIEALVDSKLTA